LQLSKFFHMKIAVLNAGESGFGRQGRMINKSTRRPGRGPVLMRDVADRAAVAISTVSRALSNPDRVSRDILERVRAAANELGYTPNAAAQNLRGKKISTVLILLSSNSLVYGVSQVVPQVLEGVSQVLSEHNIRIQFLNRYRSETADQHIIDLAYSRAIQGAIAISPDIPEIGGRSLAGAGVPIIALLADHSGVGIASVVTDDRAAVYRAAVHLLELGHRTFFYISGFRGNYHTDERFAGLRDAALSGGVKEDAICRFEHDLQFQEGFKVGEQAAQAFLALERRPTAVLACSDDAAIGRHPPGGARGAASRFGRRLRWRAGRSLLRTAIDHSRPAHDRNGQEGCRAPAR